MADGKSLPVFVTVAALSAAAVWSFAPRVVTKLPGELRANMRRAVRYASGLPACGREQIARFRSRRQAAAEETRLVGQGAAPAAAEAEGREAPVRKRARAETVQRAPRDIAGVRRVPPPEADWCVLTGTTTLEDLDGKPLGTAQGGRFFLIERRARAAGATLFIGNFTPKRLPHTVQIRHTATLPLSGSPDDLSASQAHALKMYYQLRGEALDYLDDVRAAGGETLSPHYRALAEGARRCDARLREFAAMRSLTGAQRDAELEDIDRLKREVASVRARHEAWKRANAALLAHPERDAHYRKLVGEYRRYGEDLPPGLIPNENP